MKISVDIDAKPQELREFFGLPNVEPLQQEMLEQVRQKMLGGVTGFDPTALLKPYLPEHLRGAADWQQAVWNVLRQASGRDAGSEETDDAKHASDR